MDTASAAASPDLLRKGQTAWKIAHAERVALLVDGSAYYGALREALAAARNSVFVLGRDIDSRIPLPATGR